MASRPPSAGPDAEPAAGVLVVRLRAVPGAVHREERRELGTGRRPTRRRARPPGPRRARARASASVHIHSQPDAGRGRGPNAHVVGHHRRSRQGDRRRRPTGARGVRRPAGRRPPVARPPSGWCRTARRYRSTATGPPARRRPGPGDVPRADAPPHERHVAGDVRELGHRESRRHASQAAARRAAQASAQPQPRVQRGERAWGPPVPVGERPSRPGRAAPGRGWRRAGSRTPAPKPGCLMMISRW